MEQARTDSGIAKIAIGIGIAIPNFTMLDPNFIKNQHNPIQKHNFDNKNDTYDLTSCIKSILPHPNTGYM